MNLIIRFTFSKASDNFLPGYHNLLNSDLQNNEIYKIAPLYSQHLYRKHHILLLLDYLHYIKNRHRNAKRKYKNQCNTHSMPVVNILRKTSRNDKHHKNSSKNTLRYGYNDEYFPQRSETNDTTVSKVVQTSLLVQPKKDSKLRSTLREISRNTGILRFPLQESVPGTLGIAPPEVVWKLVNKETSNEDGPDKNDLNSKENIRRRILEIYSPGFVGKYTKSKEMI